RGGPPRLSRAGREVQLVRHEDAQRLERAGALLEVEKIRKRCGLARRAGVPIGLPRESEPGGRPDGSRTQEYGVNDAEDGAVGADPQRERGEDERGERPI